jgi:branched-chain amino acid aminotransferase
MLNYPAWNGSEYCEVKDLTVSILDLGLIHCDATYDVIAVKDGRIVNLEAHVRRFQASCDGWKLKCPDADELTALFVNLVKKSPTKDLLLWVAVTRGIPRSGNPRDLANCDNRLIAYTKPYFGFNASNTATVCLAKQQRNTSFDQRMKNFSWNDLTLAQWEAIERGYDTAVLLDSRGFLTEGPGFNVGIIRDGKVYAPKHNRLDGTVMNQVALLCMENGVEFHWAAISTDQLYLCDAMFLTSTAGNVIDVSCFDNIYFEENKVIKWLQLLI